MAQNLDYVRSVFGIAHDWHLISTIAQLSDGLFQTKMSEEEDFNRAKFAYIEDNNTLKIGHRKTNGTVGQPVGNARQGWMITPGEGTELFIEESEQYPGLDKDVRRALFLDFDREAVENALW